MTSNDSYVDCICSEPVEEAQREHKLGHHISLS